MSRVYDCFCYYNEDKILQLRLATLWDQVDVFVISEASYSHTGETRELRFDPARFGVHASRIRYLPLHHRPPGENDFWKNENFIRNNLALGVEDAAPEDRIIISDLDEIPAPAALSLYDPKYLRGDFEQRYYSYFLNNLWIGDVDRFGHLIPDSNIWRGSKITTFRHFVEFFHRNATSVRSYKSSGPLRSIRREWFKRFNVQRIRDGGWHFTWMYDVPGIIDKIEHTAHQEFNRAELKDPAYIKRMILAGRDFHKPHARYQAQRLNGQFPRHLELNKDQYDSMLLPVPDEGA